MSGAIALVLGAGRSRRMAEAGNKLLLEAAGRSVLAWTLEVFERCPAVARIYLTASEGDLESYRALVGREGFRKVADVIVGGAERQESVHRALRHIRAVDAAADPMVAVHDGARPLLGGALLERLLAEAAASAGGAILAVPAKETMKRVAADGVILETVPRESLMAAQTPQVFRLSALLEAHARGAAEGFTATDDAVLMERLGHAVRVVVGGYENFKITTPEDLVALEGFLASRGVRG